MPPPVPATYTIRLASRIIAWITYFCNPRSRAAGSAIITRNYAFTSIIRNRANRRNRAFSRTFSNASAFRLSPYPPITPPPLSLVLNPKNRYYYRLTRRNPLRCTTVPVRPYYISRVYIIPVTYVLYPACKSYTLSNVSSSFSLNAPFSPTVSFNPNALFKYRFNIPIANYRYALIPTGTPIYRPLYFYIIRYIRFTVYVYLGIGLLRPPLFFLPVPSSPLSPFTALSSLPSSPSSPSSPTSPFSSFIPTSSSLLFEPASRFTTLSAYKNALNSSAFFTIPYTACQNGNTNYKYYTTNSPTARGTYR